MDQKKIGKYISEKRKALGLTQVQVAQALSMSDKSVSKWERGICLPDASKYKPLCEVLNITVDELFSGETLNEREDEVKDTLINMLMRSIYDEECGISYEEFKNALIRMSEATVLLSKFKCKEAAVEYLVKETGLPTEECANAYEYFTIDYGSNYV